MTPELAAAIRSYTSGVLLARAAYRADRTFAARLCTCGRRLETTARICRPCRRARNARKEIRP